MYLTDREIIQLLRGKPSLVEGMDAPEGMLSKDSPVQPCSLDLHVGAIYRPDARQTRGSCPEPKGSATLHQGETVVIETAEKLQLPDNIAAIGFSPSHVAAKGLLMTNPGHIDPGFKGPLKFTVINMSRDHYDLRKGDLAFTVLFSRLGEDVQYSYSARNPKPTPFDPREVNRLSHDFLDVEKRARDVARHYTVLVSVIVTAIVALAATIQSYMPALRNVERNLINLERQVPTNLAADLTSLKKDVASLHNTLSAQPKDYGQEIQSLKAEVTLLHDRDDMQDVKRRIAVIEQRLTPMAPVNTPASRP